MIMLENAATVQLIVEVAGGPAPVFPRADIETLKHDMSQPEQFTVHFDYLVRRVKHRELPVAVPCDPASPKTATAKSVTQHSNSRSAPWSSLRFN